MERSKRLEDAVGMQLFTRGVKTLHMRDVQNAEDLLNKHCQIKDEIGSKQDTIGTEDV